MVFTILISQHNHSRQNHKLDHQPNLYCLYHSDLKRLENISSGVVNGDTNIQDLIGRADKCLYQAKTSGRNAIATE